ncbi:centrosome-associated protein 350-like isoform X4 [Oncorhynchus clarkii lewisi]|uniref:centrosome-associated protein 350-like isoform X4 n=1 Tax=Oncorhynchus clarkii lewisi TaxID=490388 RepID=UPI0039B99DEA
MDTKKSSGGVTRKVSRRDGRRTEDCSQAGGTSKSRRRSHRSPDKSSRSPLRNTTQDSNVHRNNCVEFKEPLTSYREATPTPPLTSSQSLQSEDATPPPPDSCLSQLVYQSDTRDQQTRGDLDSTHSSALDSTVVRYLNHCPTLEALRPPGHTATARDANKEGGPEHRPKAHTLEGPAPPPAETVSSSPGSASQRLENLRRRKPDDKLEKLKETIRRQREHLEAADRDRLLEQPVGISGAVETTTVPTAKIRKVAAAPPAPIYKASHPRSNSDPCPELNRRSRPSSSERPCSRDRTTQPTPDPFSAGPDEDRALNTDLLSVDIRGILDDLQLEHRAEERAPPRMGSVSGARTTAWTAGCSSLRGSRSASPTKRNKPEPSEPGPKKRHYDADSVRQYITRQQEERKRRLVEERRAQREEAESRSQRLQELYRKQRAGVANKGPAVLESSVQKRLQETYTKLLLEQAELEEEPLPYQTQPVSTTVIHQQRPLYQPSGESDKENKRQERPQSASSSSDLSLSEIQPPPLSRNEMGLGVPSWLQPDHLSSAVRPSSALAPPTDKLFSLGLETGGGSGVRGTSPPARPQHSTLTGAANKTKMNRIEALKATAASLSTRIESEAWKLAGTGINYGCARDMDLTGLTHLQPQDDGCRAKPVSPSVRERTDAADELSLRIQRLLSAGQSTYNEALPGVGDLHSFREQRGGASASGSRPQTSPGLGSHKRPEEHPEVPGKTKLHDSSGDSISEGPLLSDGSLSEGNESPRMHIKRDPKPAERLRSLDFCAGQREGVQPISHFQRAAEKYPALSTLPFSQPRDRSRGPWEELTKGSPHSVINIFTKNHLHNHTKVGGEEQADRSSPAVHCGPSAASSVDVAPAYEDDFVSSRSSGGGSSQSKKGYNGCSITSGNSHYGELMSRRSPYDTRTIDLPSHHSSGSTPVSSLHSKGSVKRGTASDKSDATLVEEQRSPCSPGWESLSRDSRRGGSASERSSIHSLVKSVYTDSTLGGASGHLHCSVGLDSKKSPRSPSPSPAGSPTDSSSRRVSPGSASLAGADILGLGSGCPHSSARPSSSSSRSTTLGGRAEPTAAGELHYTPGVLQQRMSAELHYLESIEESVRQLGDMERLRGVSLAQQESVSLAQILKAQQQRHERDLHELKVKAEQEALETQWQLEETRQKAARAHVELQENMAQTQQQSLGGMQEANAKMISQQAESVRYTAVAAHQIKEMTELACSQIGDPAAAPISTLFDQQKQHHQSFMGEMSSAKNKTEEPFSLDSHSDSTPSRRPNISGGESSHRSPSLASYDKRHRRKVETGNSSLVEAVTHTAADDSIPSDRVQSLLDEKDSASVATEYSLKFDESMTEDEIEERSFRSLLPSESHRRGVLEKNRVPHEESDDVPSQENPTAQDSSKQDGSMPFSSGQDSFSRFTMDMVRQYMKEEEVRAHHQSSLLRLRQKALKEKTKAELAWLEHQKRRLRDKGEDDKMPPIRKKQRGLLMKLQQEQAEIKRLQEANRAARKERQLLLKQQEEIARMRYTTLKLKERLKCVGTEDTPPTPVSEHVEGATSPSAARTDGDVRSASPLSVSGSETSSIMQKLKKMRSHMDKKFLTKREQGLMHRRRHAEELLEWKQRLDAEEAEVRRMEKQALAAWDRERPGDGDQRSDHRDRSKASPNASSGQHDPEGKTDRDSVSEGDYSPVVTGSSVHTELSGSQQPDIPSTDQPGSVSELPSTQRSPSIYTQDLDSPPASKRSPSPKASLSTNTHPEGSSSSKMQLRSSSRTSSHDPKAADTPSGTRTEPMSDQSDIESRIRALKEELRKRKSVVYQLKKEQKKRHKERLKAQEASLLKQLESYNYFIEKTETELSKEPDSTPAAKPQILAPTSATEKPKIKPPPPYRPETDWKVVSDSEKAGKTLPHSPVEQDDITTSGLSKYSTWHEESSDEDPPTVTPTPVYESPEHTNSLRGLLSPEHLPRQPSEGALPLREPARPQATDSGDERVVSSHQSEVMEELDSVKSEGTEHTQSRSEDHHFDHLLKLDLEHSPSSQQHHSLSEHVSSEKGEQGISLISSLDVDEISAKSPSPIKERAYTPESDVLSSKGDFSTKGKDASPPSADGYHEDFEISVESSLREENQGSKPTSPSRQDTREASHSRSPLYSSEEEIGEEPSGRSGAPGGSPHSERLLDLQSQTKDSQVISSNCSPTISPSQTPPSPALDEMPNFAIGDRVLVSNVQPGTLRFKGHTSFANGFWAGVELDKSEGSNNGTYDGVVYFECEEDHGIFAPPDKIFCMPEKFEIYVDTTEGEDLFLDHQSENEPKKCNFEEKMHESNLQNKRGGVSQRNRSGDNGPTDVNDDSTEHQKNLINLHEFKEGEYSMSNKRTKTIILDLEDVPTSLFITDIDRKITLDETSTIIERNGLDAHQKSTPEQTVGKDTLGAFADKLLNNFMKDAVKQFAQIRKAKEEKISAVNQMKDYLFNEEGRETVSQAHVVAQRDGLPFFLDGDQEEQVSSPELCTRPESPVLGASGQEELTKRLAELELNRELLDELGDEQDWFDEDYGLSSRREQQKRKQKQEKGGLSVNLADQVKTPPRPELPRQPKLPEQPAMVVPHSAPKVEKLVDAATQEIWNQSKLGQGTQTLTGLPVPKPSEEFLGCDGKDQESQCVRSYRQAVYDLTWEIIQEIFAEDPNAHQPQWVKPRRMNSSYFHRVKSPGDITRVQAFITTEVLKLYSLKKDLNQKTDWQKMLKFGRKKRDRVDHILVQELHEEESLWVNYDEDELYVKMQLADGIFDSLIKDTAEVLTQIQEKRLKRALS